MVVEVKTVLTSLLDIEGKVPRCSPHSNPKKGNLSYCDNWRGIVLLEGIGKVVARIRLQNVADDEHPDSQSAFCKGRGCFVMIFTLCQLVEKSIEQQFSDLGKAYDSVPQEALWLSLEKLGIPTLVVIKLIKSFYVRV